MFYPPVVLEERDVVNGRLDSQNETVFVVTAVRLNRCPCPKNLMFARLRAIIFWCRFEIASTDILQVSPSSLDHILRVSWCGRSAVVGFLEGWHSVQLG
jgi:hypothetical protein